MVTQKLSGTVWLAKGFMGTARYAVRIMLLAVQQVP